MINVPETENIVSDNSSQDTLVEISPIRSVINMSDLNGRNTQFNHLKRMLTRVNQHDSNPISPETVQDKLQQASEVWIKIENFHESILSECIGEEAVQVQEDIMNNIFTTYETLRERLTTLRGNLQSSTPPQGDVSKPSVVRLPPIDLPTFEGNYADWNSFSDLFQATISSRSDISAAQKLQYLKSATKKEASELIRYLTITNDNFSIAWKILEERYNNKREMVNAIMKRLFGQPQLQREAASALQKLVDTTKECLRSLEVLKLPVEHWDTIVIFMLVDRLDAESRKQWALQLKGTSLPSLSQLFSFLDQHIRGLQASGTVATKAVQIERRNTSSSHHASSSQSCLICKQGSHPIYHCPTFKSFNAEDRKREANRQGCCLKCLSRDHTTTNCPSSSSCKHCSNPNHNSMLCYSKKKKDAHHTSISSSSASASTVSHSTPIPSSSATPSKPAYFSSMHEDTQVLLGTMMAKVYDSSGNPHQVRVLLDSASGCTMITESCANALGLKRQRSNISVQGVGTTKAGNSKGEVELVLRSNINNYQINIQALVFGSVTSNVPADRLQHKDWSHLQEITLADSHYYKPGPVDILLDADYTEEIMLQGKRRGIRFSPKACNSQFGWILTGRIKGNHQKLQSNHVHCDLEKIVERFWQLESIPKTIHLTDEQKSCEEHFLDTHRRDPQGRFVVQLPFNEKIAELGSSQSMALRRFLQVERRLTKLPDIKKQYVQFMKEYESLGHMELVPFQNTTEKVGRMNYLPHHFVIKADSSTTKLRVVFDASAKTTTGVSLNDALKVGATVQPDLFTILLKFRLFPIVIKADIAKMFRQFLLHETDCDYQRILWRESSDLPIRHYRLKTITYGTASAPFLSTRCLQQLAFENKDKYPLAAAVLTDSTYIDDSIQGAISVEEGRKLISELNIVCESAGLSLRKFCSNNISVLTDIPEDRRETETSFDLDTSESIKALGIKWNVNTDRLFFTVNLSTKGTLTKRGMLSELSKVFDPLGLISPATITAKILFQRVWMIEGLSWDSNVPPSIENEWVDYKSQLQRVKDCQIQRCIWPNHDTYHEIHAFSDASESAYGAVVYIRYQDHSGEFNVSMITAKVRVAPLKRVSIERLELCGAELLAELVKIIKSTLNLNCPVYAWTDSTIVLKYIAGHPSRWKTFIAHRVAKIQNILPVEHWRHVKGVENPADLLSRGVTATDLCSSSLWWQGPQWLRFQELPPVQAVPKVADEKLEVKKKAILSAHSVINNDLMNKYSQLGRLKRVTAIIFRFIKNCRKQQVQRGPLTPQELLEAMQFWIRRTQQVEYADELKRLENNKPIKSRSTISSLNPFLDTDGVIKVGGRLSRSELPHDQKHQIVIPHNSHLGKLLIQQSHHVLYHSGFQATLSHLQQTFWITRARSTIKHFIRRCVVCKRQRARAAEQLMGSLPPARVTPSYPFANTGIDYAGPFTLINMKGRNRAAYKGYFAIFVCLSTKAVHLEAVSDLTTEAFIAALRRFVARRGLCSNIFSDCGTNFVGADRELKQFIQSAQFNQAVADASSTIDIKWNFNTPGSPHQGGLWEAGVKSVKFHLRRVIGETKLTFEEFQTVLNQVEAILNSRPLCGVSTDPNDISSLTPGHFLIGRPITSAPDGDVTMIKSNRLSRWQLCQKMTQGFWTRWRNEYLSSLQQRFKWRQKRANLSVGDLVLLNEENLPPTKWKLGRVYETTEAKDGCVRTVGVKTMTGSYQRSVTKLTPILSKFDDDE